jgi:hypothetical protein
METVSKIENSLLAAVPRKAYLRLLGRSSSR